MQREIILSVKDHKVDITNMPVIQRVMDVSSYAFIAGNIAGIYRTENRQ